MIIIFNQISLESGIGMVYKISKSILDLRKTFKCGQCFNWDEYNGAFFGFIEKHPVRLVQHPDYIEIDGNITEAQFEHYFDLNTAYVFNKITSYEQRCLDTASGIRILNQDLFETIITFIISQQNNMTRIKTIVNRLRKQYGKKYCMDGLLIYVYGFPDIDILSRLSVSDFETLGLGYRAPYIAGVCQYVYNNPEFLDQIKKVDYSQAIDSLKTFKGIGDKVANCIALFGLHHLEAFPIDVHIKRIINREYGGYIDISRFGELAGVMQQYMFYTEAFRLD